MEYRIENKQPGSYKLYLVRKDGSEMWIATRDSLNEILILVR